MLASDNFDSDTVGQMPPNGTIVWGNTSSASWLNTEMTVVNNQSQSPSNSIYSTGASGNGMWGGFTAVVNARCTIYFYDDGAAVKNQYCFMDDSSGNYGIGVAVRTTSTTSGTSNWGSNATSANKYILLYALNTSPRQFAGAVTGVDRSVGWHEVQWTRDANNTSVSLDGLVLDSVPNSEMPDWASFDLGCWNWDVPTGNTGMWFDSATVEVGRSQTAYGWYANNNAQETTSDALAAIDTAYTDTAPATSTVYRLRMQISNLDSLQAWSGASLKLQVSEGANGTWSDVTATSAAWQLANGKGANGTQVGGVLLGSSVAEEYLDTSTPSVTGQSQSVPATSSGEWDVAIQSDGTAVIGAGYYFRLVTCDASGNTLDSFTTYPELAEITLINGPTTTWQGGTKKNLTSWNTSGNWSNGVPTATTTAIIPGSTTYSPAINATATCQSLIIQSGGTLTFSGTYTLTVHGWCTVLAGGTLTQAGTNQIVTVTGAPGGVYLEGTWNQGTTATNPVTVAAGTVLAGTWNNTSANSLIQLNGGLTVQNGAAMNFSSSAAMTTGGAPITVQAGGTLNVGSTGTFTSLGSVEVDFGGLFQVTSAGTLQMVGNFANAGSMVPITGTTAGTYTWTASTASTLSGSGIFEIVALTNDGSGTLSLSPASPLAVSGQLYAQKGTLQVGASVSANTLSIASGATATVTSGGTLTVSSAFTHSAGTLAASTGGTFVASNTFTSSGGTYSGAGTYQFAGNFVSNSAQSFGSGSTETFNGTAAQTLSGSAVTTFGALLVNKSNTLTASVAVTTSGDLTVQSGTFATGAGALNVGGNFNLTGGTLNLTASAFNVGAGWAFNAGAFSGNALNVTFNGASSGSIGGSLVTNFNNLTVNKTGGTLTQAQDTVVGGALTATAGTIAVPGSATITVRGNATRTGATFSSGPNLIFDQTAAQNLTWGGATIASVQMIKTGGTLTNTGANLVVTTLTLNGSGGTMTMMDGATARTLTVGSGGLTIANGTLVQGSTVSDSGVYTQTGGTFTGSSSTIGTGAFTLGGGTFNDAAAGAVTITGNFVQSGGTYTAPTAASTLAVAGGFLRNGGTFTNSGAVGLSLTGAAAATLGGTVATSLASVTVNRTGGTLTLNEALSVGSATFTAGAVAPGAFTHAVTGAVTISSTASFTGNNPSFSAGGTTNSNFNIAAGVTLGALTVSKSGAGVVTFSGATSVAGAVTLSAGGLNLSTNNPALTVGSYSQTGGTLTAGTGMITLNGNWSYIGGTVSGSPSVTSAAGGTISGSKNIWNNYTVNTAVTMTQNATLHVQGTFTMQGTANYTVSSGYLLNTQGDASISGTLSFSGAAGGQWVSDSTDPTTTIADGTTVNLPGTNTFAASQTFIIGKNCTINLNGPLTLNGSVTVNGAGSDYASGQFTTVEGLSGGSYHIVFNNVAALHYVRFQDLNDSGTGGNTGVELGGSTAYTTTFDHVLFLSGTSSAATSRYLTISGAGRNGATLANVGFFTNSGGPVPNSTIWRNSGTGSASITVTSYLTATSYIGGDSTDNDDGNVGGNNVNSNETLVAWGTAQAPTPAFISRLNASTQARQTVVQWNSASEHQVLGYFVYRSADGRSWQALNADLLPASIESMRVHRYKFVGAPGAVQSGDWIRLAEMRTDLTLHWIPHAEMEVATVSDAGAPLWPTAWDQSLTRASNLAGQLYTDYQLHATSGLTARYGPTAVGRPARVLLSAPQIPAQQGSHPEAQAENVANANATSPSGGSVQTGVTGSYTVAGWHQQATPPSGSTTSNVTPPSTGATPPATARPIKFLSGQGLKITVDADGMYAIPLSALPAQAQWLYSPTGLALSHLDDYDGQSRPMQFATVHGQPSLVFYGRDYSDAYTADNTYWFGQFPNDPVKTATMDAALRPTSGYHLASATHEVNAYYYFNQGGTLDQPNYYDDASNGLIENSTETYTLNTLHKVAGTAYVQVALNSYTESVSIAPDHQLNVLVNGVLVASETWDGKGYRVVEVPFDAALLNEGANTIALQTPAPPTGVTYDRSLIDTVTLLYPQSYVANGNELTVDVFGGARVDVTGFTTSDIKIVDLRQVGREQFVTGTVYTTAGGGYGIRYTNGATATRLYFLTTAQYKTPAAVAYRVLSNDRGGVCDYAAVGSSANLAAANALVKARAAEGLTTREIDQDWAVEQFGYGRFGPEPIRDALRTANPRYVLLVGATVVDYHFLIDSPSPVGLPGFFVMNSLQGKILTDQPYGDFNGDGLVDAAVGRLPGETSADIQTAAQKIIGYTPAADGAALVADNVDPYYGLDFKGDLENLAGQMTGVPLTKIYRQDLANDTAADTALTAAFNANTPVIVYEGHAATYAFGDSRWFDTTDAAALTGTATVLAGTCHTADFTDPSSQGLGQTLLASPHGAVSYVGSMAAANGPAEGTFVEDLTLKLFEPSAPRRIGDAFVAVSRQLISSNAGMDDLVHSYVLLGDPAAPVRR
ncbi:MAG: C25 family cysteine peptidase [Planctomycetota bacterium]